MQPDIPVAPPIEYCRILWNKLIISNVFQFVAIVVLQQSNVLTSVPGNIGTGEHRYRGT